MKEEQNKVLLDLATWVERRRAQKVAVVNALDAHRTHCVACARARELGNLQPCARCIKMERAVREIRARDASGNLEESSPFVKRLRAARVLAGTSIPHLPHSSFLSVEFFAQPSRSCLKPSEPIDV